MRTDPPASSDEAARNLGFEEAYRDADFADHYARKHERSRSHRRRDAVEQEMWRDLLRDHAPYRSILDCPAGTGRFWPLLSELGESLSVADASREMLDAAARKHPEITIASREVGLAQDLPFADGSFDLVFSSRLLHHFPAREDRLAVLRGLARTSAQWLAFSTWRDGNWMSWRETKWKERRDARTRFFLPLDQILDDVHEAGLELVKLTHKQRLLSPVVALLCRRR